MRLVAGRTEWSHLDEDEQVDRERKGERNQSCEQARERDAVASGPEPCNRKRLPLLLDVSSHADRSLHRSRNFSTPRKSAEKAVCIPQAMSVAPGITIRSVSG